jgi:N-acetylglucosamine-6-sulfatase
MKFQKVFCIALFIIFLFTPFSLTGCALQTEEKNPSQTDKPNIIIILTDDQPYASLEHMPIVQKELVQNGITFDNAYATTPLCCPSRASILTGLYAHNHGVKTNRYPNGGAQLFKDESTLAAWLNDAGYQTALMGKYLNDYDSLDSGKYVPPGWDEWNAFVKIDPDKDYYFGYTLNENGNIIQYGHDQKDFSNDVLNDKAIDFIHANNDKPFFLMLNFYSPHQTFLFAERHKNLFKEYTDEFQPYNPPNYFEEDLSDKPAWLISHEQPEPSRAEGIYQRILRSLASVDESVGNVVRALEEEGIRDNTLIIFMSDNGYALGDHGLIGKACPYEACLHVPFVVSYPDKISASRVDSNMVLNIDIAPTLTDLVGAPSISEFDGQSFLPLLDDPTFNWRDGFLFEQYQDDGDGEEQSMTSLVPPFFGFQTSKWKYVEYETGEKELYDLQADPYELNNLSDQPGYEDVMTNLHERIEEARSQ